jgi:hypothetical protein
LSTRKGRFCRVCCCSWSARRPRFLRNVVTDETGAYQFPQIPPGAYELWRSSNGFAEVKQRVTLQVNTPATLDVKMQLAGLSEAVTVTADAIMLNTTDASVGNAFGEQQVRQLPLITRNVVELLSLQPGVTPTGEVVGCAPRPEQRDARRRRRQRQPDGRHRDQRSDGGLQLLERRQLP